MNFDAKMSVEDPSDWSDTVVPSMSELDAMIRCQICKGFLRAPVTTSCGHVFCSICIREALAVRNQCPLCQEEIFESGLRKTLLLDGVVKWFTENRVDYLEKLKNKPKEIVQAPPVVEEVIDLTDDTTVTTSNLVQCPICSRFMTITELQGSHIDECLKRESSKPKRTSSSHTGSISQFFSPHKKRRHDETHQLQPVNTSRKPIPKFDSTISTSKLRAKLASYDLPTKGSRDELSARLQQYINLYNANLDSLEPVDERILVSNLHKWELLNGGAVPQEVDHKDTKSGKQWRSKYNSDYRDLIKAAKENMEKSTQKAGMHREEK